MKDSEKISAVTDAGLDIEVVCKEELGRLKVQKPTYVNVRGLRSSNGILISEDFSRCQGVGFWDKEVSLGALAHNYSRHDPYDTLTGEWAEPNREDPKAVFDDLSRVVAVHAYHKNRHEWPERWIEGALAKIDVKRVVHVPIKSRENGRTCWFHMALDARQGRVYIFPTDFDYGISFPVSTASEQQKA